MSVASVDPNTPPPPPPPGSDPAAFNKAFNDFKNKVAGDNVSGDADPDLAPPPGVTARQVSDIDPDAIQNVNKMKWQGKGEGDMFAQQHGFKDLNDMLNSTSPEAAKDTAELLHDVKAANHATEADGAARPDQEANSDTLSGIRGSGEVDPGSTGAILQDKIVHGQSMDGKTTFATKRTYADGESMSNSKMIGNRIADVFKKILSVVCPPLEDLVQMAQDGATKIRDNSVGDKDAAANDSKAIKEDGKSFGKDFGMQAVTDLMDAIPGLEEVGIALKAGQAGAKLGKGVERAGENGAKEGENGTKAGENGTKAGENGTKAGENGTKAGEKDGESDIPQSSITKFAEELQDKVFGNEFIQKLGGAPKNATKEEKKEYVKQKVHDQIDNVMQQLGFPQNGNSPPAQTGGSDTDLAVLLAELQADINRLKKPN